MIIKADTQAGRCVWLVDQYNTKIDNVISWDTDKKVAIINIRNDKGLFIGDGDMKAQVSLHLPSAGLIIDPDHTWNQAKELGLTKYISGAAK